MIELMAWSVMGLGLAITIFGLRRFVDVGPGGVGVGVGLFLMGLVMLVREPPMIISGGASVALAIPAAVLMVLGAVQLVRTGRTRGSGTR